MIELRNITKSFADGTSEREVLSNLNLTVQDGEFVAITGVSGSGKTTLLSILGTSLQPDGGTYLLNGQQIPGEEKMLARLRNQQIGVVFQEHRLLPQLTALENVLLPLLATKKETTSEDEKKALDLMQLTGVSALANKFPATLSGGEQARVAICRALIQSPSLLLADEPTGQLDKENARLIAELFLKINKELHTTIIVVTHSQELAECAGRACRLEQGRLCDVEK